MPIFPPTDQEIRADAVRAAATLCSGALSINSVMDESDADHISKVVLLAEAFTEYIKLGTLGGLNVKEMIDAFEPDSD